MTSPKKRRWWKTTLKALVFLIAVFITLTALTASVISFLGRREWASVKAELTARGEPLSLAAIWPPPIPDAQNFFADPLWMELADLVDSEMDFDGQKVATKQIRLPKGERQIDGLNPSLNPDERQRLGAAFPEFPIPEDSTVAGIVRQVFQRGKNATPPAQKEAAAFILAVLAHNEPVLARLENLARRPGARFPLDYPDLAAVGDRTGYLLMISQLLRARVWANLQLGDTVAAHRDVMTLLRLPDTLSKEPLLISFLVAMPLASLALESVSEGLNAHSWTATELEEIERSLGKLNFPAMAAMALRGERGFGNQFLEDLHQTPKEKRSATQRAWSSPIASPWMWTFGPGDEALRNMMFQNWIDVLDQTPQQGLNARTFSVFDRDVKFVKANPWNRLRYAISAIGFPSLANIAQKSAQLQDQIQQARTVCALERYRLKNGDYPEELSSLVPEFLPTVPLDVATVRPLIYRREGKSFCLWTPGWDEKDDGSSSSDWVWGDKILKKNDA